MAKRVISGVVALILSAAMVIFCTGTVFASEDSADELAWSFMEAVELGHASMTTTIYRSDVEAFLDEIFARYPVLYHYYDGASWTTGQISTELTVKLKNHRDKFQDIPVVDSDEDLLGVVGMALAELKPHVKFIVANGYDFENGAMERVLDQLHHGYYLTYMGYENWSANYFFNDRIGVYDYVLSFGYFYGMPSQTFQQWRDETESVVKYLAESLFAQDMPDYLRAIRIHDWLVNNSYYNTANLDDPWNYVAYGPIVYGSGVCMGYAESIVLLFQAAGIETRYVSGTGTNSYGHTESHAWNAVKIGDAWYMLDATWDDPVTEDGSDVLQYDYFNVTSEQLAKDHDWDWASAPYCDGTTYNADYVQQLAQSDYNTYLEFTSSKLVTQEEAKAYFRSVCSGIPVVLPEKKQIPETNPPEPTDGSALLKPQNNPQNQPVNPKPSGSSGGYGADSVILFAAIGILSVGAVVAIIKVRRDNARKRASRSRNMRSTSRYSKRDYSTENMAANRRGSEERYSSARRYSGSTENSRNYSNYGSYDDRRKEFDYRSYSSDRGSQGSSDDQDRRSSVRGS